MLQIIRDQEEVLKLERQSAVVKAYLSEDWSPMQVVASSTVPAPVSYTHLTLPTICSV